MCVWSLSWQMIGFFSTILKQDPKGLFSLPCVAQGGEDVLAKQPGIENLCANKRPLSQ